MQPEYGADGVRVRIGELLAEWVEHEPHKRRAKEPPSARKASDGDIQHGHPASSNVIGEIRHVHRRKHFPPLDATLHLRYHPLFYILHVLISSIDFPISKRSNRYFIQFFLVEQ